VTDWKGSFKATAVGTLVGTAFGLLAFFFLTKRQFPSMGVALFFATPVAAGFSVAMVARKGSRAAAATLLSLVVSLALLIGLGKEGVLCAALAFPIMIAGLGLGVGMGMLARLLVNRAKNQNTATGVLLLAGPLLVFAGERIDRPTFQDPRTEIVQTAVEVNAPAEEVWPRIVTVDNVHASKPFLMYIGLPIPQTCVMQGRGIGAKRTCYFNVGYIEETVTAWRPPYYMALSIDRTHMPGRHWLAFEYAEYRLEPVGQKTLLTRRTTVSSHLHPAWYWRPFERLGVEDEHNYILQDVVLKTAH
jgi:Polyketide cyclase / dehydrase and lipid transport